MPPGAAHAWETPPSSGTADSRLPFGEGRRRPPKRPSSLLAAALALSLSLHVALLVIAAISSWLDHRKKDADPASAFEIVDASELHYIPPLPEVDLPAEPVEARKDGQLVELAAPRAKEEAPKDARFLAEHDRKVEQETRSRETALTPEVLADRFRGHGADPSQGEAATQGKNGPGEDAGAAEKTEKSRLASRERRIDEMLSNDPFGIRVKTPVDGASGAGGGRAAHETVAAGNGAKVAMAGAPNNDYLPDVREGDATLLNSKETFFASFWNRVQRQVEPLWAQNVRSSNPGQLQRRDYHTVVNVVLSARGDLVAVEVVRSCGIAAWDRAVQEAFREAAPYLNPPKELVSADGRIYMDDLGWVVQVSKGQVMPAFDPRSGKLFPGVREGYGPGR